MTDPTIISVLNPKGGVGKSTISIHLANGLSQAGNSTVLLDTDPQGSAIEWDILRSNRESGESEENNRGSDPVRRGPAVDSVDLRLEENKLAMEILRHQGQDFVVVDGSAKTNSSLGASLRESDLVLIPTRPSMLDFRGTSGFMDLVESVQNGFDAPANLPVARGIATQVRAGTQEVNTISGVFDALQLQELQYNGTPIRMHQRVAYSRSLASGTTVLDRWTDHKGRTSKDKKAREEAIMLTNATIQVINQKVFATNE